MLKTLSNIGEIIPEAEVQFHPHSFADPMGRLFSWRGEIYRAITSAAAPFVDTLFRKGIVDELVERRLLVETKQTPLKLEGYDVILHHRRIDFVSYPNCWCPAMFKDALLHQCDLLLALAPHGLTLKDAHPWNVLFDFCKPLHIDFGSIVPAESGNIWRGYDEFCRFGLYPLLLMANGHDRIARHLMCEDDGVRRTELEPLTAKKQAHPFGSLLRLLAAQWRRTRGKLPLREGVSSEPRADFFAKLRDEIAQVELEQIDATSEVQDATVGPLVSRILAVAKCETLLDIGCECSLLAAENGCKTVAIDQSPQRVTTLYRSAGERTILPLVLDIKNPSPTRGIQGHSQIGAQQRLRCDLVFAGSVVENLSQRYHLKPEQVVAAFAEFAKRFLLIELPPRSGGACFEDRRDFIRALESEFSEVHLEKVSPERVFAFCRR